MDCLEKLKQSRVARAMIEAADSLAALGAVFRAAAEALGAPYYRISKFAPRAGTVAWFEALIEHVPEPLTYEALMRANPDFFKGLRRLLERETAFDSQVHEAWRRDERRALAGAALEAAGIAQLIVAPRFGGRGLNGYAALFLRTPAPDADAADMLHLLASAGVARAIEIVKSQYSAARCPLTGRQREILALCAEGKSDTDIAAILGISPATVHDHAAAVLGRLGVRTRVQAVVMALQSGWLAH